MVMMTLLIFLLGFGIIAGAAINTMLLITCIKEKSEWIQFLMMFFVWIPLILAPGIIGGLAVGGVFAAASVPIAVVALVVEGLGLTLILSIFKN